MKTKSLVLFGVLIIALAAMAMPVMAAEGVLLSGEKGSGLNFYIANATGGLTFSSFGTGTHHISPTVEGTGSAGNFATVNLTTSDPTFHIYAYDANAAGGHQGSMLRGTTPMGTPMALQLVNANPHGSTSSVINALSGTTTTTLVTGNGAGAWETETPMDLDISQVVLNTDAAGTYSITLTLNYVGS